MFLQEFEGCSAATFGPFVQTCWETELSESGKGMEANPLIDTIPYTEALEAARASIAEHEQWRKDLALLSLTLDRLLREGLSANHELQQLLAG